jgi:hypothetical protein
VQVDVLVTYGHGEPKPAVLTTEHAASGLETPVLLIDGRRHGPDDVSAARVSLPDGHDGDGRALLRQWAKELLVLSVFRMRPDAAFDVRQVAGWTALSEAAAAAQLATCVEAGLLVRQGEHFGWAVPGRGGFPGTWGATH